MKDRRHAGNDLAFSVAAPQQLARGCASANGGALNDDDGHRPVRHVHRQNRGFRCPANAATDRPGDRKTYYISITYFGCRKDSVFAAQQVHEITVNGCTGIYLDPHTSKDCAAFH
jgi:hypothetical protein